MYHKLIVLLLIVCILILPMHHARAGYWSENYSANIMQTMMEEMKLQIRQALEAALKMAAIKQATSTIENSLYGESSSPRNISNFAEFLVSDPQDAAVTYGEDFLSQTLRGSGSSDYTSTSGGGGGGGDLSDMLEEAGQRVIDEWDGKNEPTVDFAESCSGDDYFSDGDFKCFSAITSNPINMPVGMALAVDSAMSAKFKAEQQIAELEATSSGVLPGKDDSGDVKLPSSVVEEIQLQQITLPLESLANGDSGAFSKIIQSFAVSLIVKIVQDGLSETQDSFDKNKDSYNDKYNDQLDKLNDRSGPGSQYSRDKYTDSQKNN